MMRADLRGLVGLPVGTEVLAATLLLVVGFSAGHGWLALLVYLPGVE